MNLDLLGVGKVLNLAEETENYIVPDYTVPYQPLPQSLEFFSWDNLVFGEEDNEVSKTHYMAMDMILSSKRDCQLICHRDYAKTTIFVKKLVLYTMYQSQLPGFGLVQNAIIFSATRKQAVDILTSIKLMIDSNEFLSEALKLATRKNGKPVADREDYVCYEMPNGEWLHLQAKGALESMRGTSKTSRFGKAIRPEVLWFDDILTDAMLQSEVQRTKAVDWFFGVVTPAMREGYNRRIMVGTPMVEDDIINIVKKGSTFLSLVIRFCQQFPAEKIYPAWPEKFTPDKIIQKYKEFEEAGKKEIFDREYMLEIIPQSLVVFKPEWIQRYDYKEAKKNGKLKSLLTFSSIDLAVTQFSTSANTSIITIGVTPDDYWYVLKVRTGKLDPKQIFDEIFEQKKRFRFIKFKAEKVGIQYLFNYFFKKEQEERKINIDIDFLTSNTKTSKHTRIMSLQPLVKEGKIKFPKNCETPEEEMAVEQLINTMTKYLITGPTTKTVDDLDCLANFKDEGFVYAPDPEYAIVADEIEGDETLDIIPYGEE